MNLRILASARNDLADGRDFYERQGKGLGGYFLDSIFPTLILWRFTPEFTARFLVFTGCCPNDFPTESITSSMASK